MIRAFWSEWLKIRRPAMILGGAGAMVGFAVLAIVLTLSQLGRAGAAPAAPVGWWSRRRWRPATGSRRSWASAPRSSV